MDPESPFLVAIHLMLVTIGLIPVYIISIPIWLVVPVFILSCFCIYRFAFARYKFFKDKSIPYVKPQPVLGSVREVRKLGFHQFQLNYVKQLGPVFGFFIGQRPLLSISDPELLKHILVKDFNNFRNHFAFLTFKKPMDITLLFAENEVWKKIRTTASPTFTAGKIRQTVPEVTKCLNSLIVIMEKAAREDKSLEVFRLYGRFTMDGILSFAFGRQANLQSKEEISTFTKKTEDFFKLPAFLWLIDLFGTPTWIRSHLTQLLSISDPKYFVDLLKPVIEERRRSGKNSKKDFLDMMLTETPEGLTKLSDDEIIATSITFLLAGYETTANALAYTTYLLALNPEIQEKLYTEVSEKLRDDQDLSVYDRIQGLEYLDSVLSESLRLYPPAYQTNRVAEKDWFYNIGDHSVDLSRKDEDCQLNQGFRIPKGIAIIIPIWAIHHNPDYWENPEVFNPDRFSSKNRKKINPLTYLPFGYGPRNCVGMRFALLEAKLVLATVIKKFKFEANQYTETPLSVRLGLTMSPKNGIHLRIVLRE